jgi:hypothetical protein
MARDVALIAGPPEIHGEEVFQFAWNVLINLRGLLRSNRYLVEPTPEGARKNGALFVFAAVFGWARFGVRWEAAFGPMLNAEC